ncbi:MAG: DUF4382 domain-containing protein [Firmicutes bacterium]|nr:DUF4382 domain-containing protein [Bacillota bacterium]
MKIKVLILLGICILYSFILFGCGTAPTPESSLKISLTDAPAVDNFEQVNITITEVAIAKSTDENTPDWITLSNTPQEFDLMQLSGGALATLGVKDLAPGHYSQIRFTVFEGEVVVGGTTYPLQVNSGTVKLTNAFDLVDGITTELIVDFDVAHSINKSGSGLNVQYEMTPVTRVIDKATTGAISGTVSLNPSAPDVLITVSTTDGVNQIATLCKDDGTFLLGYLPVGTYNLTIEATGYVSDTSLTGITVTEGVVTPAGSVTLIQPAP